MCVLRVFFLRSNVSIIGNGKNDWMLNFVFISMAHAYRLLIFLRMIVLVLFLVWRISNKNTDAVWLWGMSVVCELWFAFSWLLDTLPKFCPVNRATDLAVLKEKFETRGPNNPTGKSDLPGIDIFVSTADPEKEPPLVTANTILSILAAEYPVEKLSCYVSDDGGALLTFEAMAEAASFANLWVPFCRKHDIEPRNPESYFSLKRDPYKNKMRPDFVKDRRRVKREYDEFKVRINGLPDSIRRRSDAYNAREEIKAMKQQRENGNLNDESLETIKVLKATWMADGTHWPGTWVDSAPEHTRGDHAGIIQVNFSVNFNKVILGQVFIVLVWKYLSMVCYGSCIFHLNQLLNLLPPHFAFVFLSNAHVDVENGGKKKLERGEKEEEYVLILLRF